MKNFNDVSTLHRVLTNAFNTGEGQIGREALAQKLQELLEFDQSQAHLYSWTVLWENSSKSADHSSANAYKLLGRWSKGNSDGSAGNLLVTRTESWLFNEDLTYQHKHERYEGYSSPFGGSYSRPSASSETGIWAPSDRLTDETNIVAISSSGWSRQVTIGWLGSSLENPTSCIIEGERFAKQ
jgi:hypothetical protein